MSFPDRREKTQAAWERQEKSAGPATILDAAGQGVWPVTVLASQSERGRNQSQWRGKKKPAPNRTAEETEAAPFESLDPRRPDRLSWAILGPGRALLEGWYLVCIAGPDQLQARSATQEHFFRGWRSCKKRKETEKNQQESPARRPGENDPLMFTFVWATKPKSPRVTSLMVPPVPSRDCDAGCPWGMGKG